MRYLLPFLLFLTGCQTQHLWKAETAPMPTISTVQHEVIQAVPDEPNPEYKTNVLLTWSYSAMPRWDFMRTFIIGKKTKLNDQWTPIVAIPRSEATEYSYSLGKFDPCAFYTVGVAP